MLDFLRGVKVLDATTIVLGPYAGRMLGDLGAEVVKLESPEGDLFRFAAPAREESMGAGYMNVNINKRSIALDLKKEASRGVLRSLVEWADVVMHNMRPKAATRVGLGAETVCDWNEGVVYCYSGGFGTEGRLGGLPAYDDVLQGASGLASLNSGSDGEPRYVPSIICDKVTGLHMVVGVLSGLMRKGRTGKGCVVEAPMYESMASFLFAEHLGGETFRPAVGDLGYSRLLTVNRRPWRTSDGYISALPYTTRHWESFFTWSGNEEVLEREEWIRDPSGRAQKVGELYRLAREIVEKRTTAQWLAGFREMDVPAAPVNDLASILEDGHMEDVGMFRSYKAHGWDLRMVRTPFRVEGEGIGEEEEDAPAPRLGEHGREILGELGYGEEVLDELEREGILCGEEGGAGRLGGSVIFGGDCIF